MMIRMPFLYVQVCNHSVKLTVHHSQYEAHGSLRTVAKQFSLNAKDFSDIHIFCTNIVNTLLLIA